MNTETPPEPGRFRSPRRFRFLFPSPRFRCKCPAPCFPKRRPGHDVLLLRTGLRYVTLDGRRGGPRRRRAGEARRGGDDASVSAVRRFRRWTRVGTGKGGKEGIRLGGIRT